MYYKLFYKWDPSLVQELNKSKEMLKEYLLTKVGGLPAGELRLLFTMEQIMILLRAATESRMAMEH